jgi:tripartite-type tricarboxylate transporter receptor subunit TctC
MVVPWPPGQATDLIGRILAQSLSQSLGQPVVVENRAGAGGMIGTDAVAKAAPDGYTILAASSGPVTINPLLRRTAYDPERDLAPVAMAGSSPYVLVTRADFPASNLAEFIAVVRATPGHFTFASSGTGATAHLVAEIFNRRAGLAVTHVPFNGSAPGVTAVVGGQVDYTLETLAATQPVIRSSSVKAFGISLVNGSKLAPEIPPLASAAGLDGFDLGAWLGLMVPMQTPALIVARLAEGVREAMGTPEVLQRIEAAGLETTYRDTAAFATVLRSQRDIFAEVIRAASIQIE